MKTYSVTIPFKKHPWYTVTGIKATTRSEANITALRQLRVEQPDLTFAPHGKLIAKVV